VSDEVELPDLVLPAGSPVPSVLGDPELVRRIDEHDGVGAVVPLLSGFAAGAPVRYWDVGPAPDRVAPIFVLHRRTETGLEPIAHPPVFEHFPGDAGYSPFWAVFAVEIAGGYDGQLLTSVAAIAQAQQRGLVLAPRLTDTIVNCPVLAGGVVVETGGGPPVPTATFFWNGLQGTYHDFGPTAQAPDGVGVAEGAIYVLRREGGDPLSEPDRGVDMNGDGDTRDSNNVLARAGGDPLFSARCAEVHVTVPAGTASIDGDDAPAITGAGDLFAGGVPRSPPVIAVRPGERRFNCPVQPEVE
jgi:hypothetical protein